MQVADHEEDFTVMRARVASIVGVRMIAVPSSTLSMPSYARALWTLRTSLSDIGHVAVACTARATTCS